MIDLITTLLNIESPTYKEQDIQAFIKETLTSKLEFQAVFETKDSLIFAFPFKENKPHICFVGHTDVVPAHFTAHTQNDKLHGAGASDMKAAVGVFMHLLLNHPEVQNNYNISFISYVREEGTAIEENGLHNLIQDHPDFFKSIDLAIIGEPTDNTIQIGCVGSIHCEVTIHGESAHSARPWNGKNALYEALPFITKIANTEPKKHTVFGVDFFDVLEITESETDKGRTTIPGSWKANINFRYAPTRSLEDAENELHEFLINEGLSEDQFHLTDAVYAGKVVETPLFKTIVESIGAPIKAKQAWTDVAQFAELGIPAFNFGPGLTEQAHKPNEYIKISDIETYAETLTRSLT